MTANDGPESVVLPCGCRIDFDVIDDARTMIVTACAAGERCQYVLYVLEEAARQGKPGTVIG